MNPRETNAPACVALTLARYTRGSAIPGDNDLHLAQAIWDDLLIISSPEWVPGGYVELTVPVHD